jgi:hypothetical protein
MIRARAQGKQASKHKEKHQSKAMPIGKKEMGQSIEGFVLTAIRLEEGRKIKNDENSNADGLVV